MSLKGLGGDVFQREKDIIPLKGWGMYSREKGYCSFERGGGCIPERKEQYAFERVGDVFLRKGGRIPLKGGVGDVFQREWLPFLKGGGGVFQIERLSTILLKGGGGAGIVAKRLCIEGELILQ